MTRSLSEFRLLALCLILVGCDAAGPEHDLIESSQEPAREKTAFIVSAGSLAQTEIQAAFAEFRELERTIESNCYDCYGKSEVIYREAVAELDALVESGFASVEAKRMLADGLREIALTYEDTGSDERTNLLDRHKHIYLEELIPENPRSVELLAGYALVAFDEEATRLTELLRQRLTMLLADTLFAQGARLDYSEDSSDQRRGLGLIAEAYELATGIARINYGNRLASSLSKSGQQDEADRIRAEVREYRER